MESPSASVLIESASALQRLQTTIVLEPTTDYAASEGDPVVIRVTSEDAETAYELQLVRFGDSSLFASTTLLSTPTGWPTPLAWLTLGASLLSVCRLPLPLVASSIQTLQLVGELGFESGCRVVDVAALRFRQPSTVYLGVPLSRLEVDSVSIPALGVLFTASPSTGAPRDRSAVDRVLLSKGTHAACLVAQSHLDTLCVGPTALAEPFCRCIGHVVRPSQHRGARRGACCRRLHAVALHSGHAAKNDSSRRQWRRRRVQYNS